MADAKESPGKALREDVQAKQQALDEAKAALDKYEADKAAAANADAAEDAPMPDAPEASDDEEDDELAGAARNVAQRRDGDVTARESRPATPAPEALAAPLEAFTDIAMSPVKVIDGHVKPVIELMLTRELGEPFRRDAMKLPQRKLAKYSHTSMDAESATGQPIDLVTKK